MPTAAKLVSAIYMALASVAVIMIVVGIYPSLEREENRMALTAAVVGMLVGWRSLGARIAFEKRSAMNLGIRAGFSAFVWVLFVFALDAMIAGMFRHLYYEPIDAVLQIPAKMLSYSRAAMDIKIVGAMVVLSALGGVIAKRTGERWS